MRIAVTGANGFIGQCAVRHLQGRGREVHTIGRSPSTSLDGVIHHRFNLLSENGLCDLVKSIRPTHLLHLAWSTTPGKFWSATENLDWVSASLRLLRAFSDAGGHRITCAGTCAEYEWRESPFERHPLPLNESSTPILPATLYGTAKNSVRVLIRAAAPSLGISAAWGRIFFVYGPGEPPGRLIPDITMSLLHGRTVDCSDGFQKRDFLHVDDVGRAFSELLLSNVEGSVNIARGTSVSVRDIVGGISSIIGRPELVRFGGKATSPDEPSEIVADVTRLKSELGFQPRHEFADGMRDTVEWWRKRLASTAVAGPVA